jgi:glycosyltransferase 2 family protein
MDRHGSALKAGLGYALAAACLTWAFHDVKLEPLWRDAGRIEWRWMALAVVFDVLSYVCQGARWAILLQRQGRISVLQTTRAVYAGLFVNELLPLRVGEALRAWLVARCLKVSVARVFPSVLVERFLDAVWLVAAVALTVLFVPLPTYLKEAEAVLSGVVLAAGGIFVYLVLRHRGKPGERPGKLRRTLYELSGGVAEIGRSRWLYVSAALSVLMLILQVLSFGTAIWGYRLPLSIWHGAAVLLILRLGTAVPSAPSNVGTYQFFTIVGLTLFEVDRTTAAGFSVVAFLVLTMPLWAIGGLVFARTGLTLRSVRGGLAGSLEEA